MFSFDLVAGFGSGFDLACLLEYCYTILHT